MIGFLISLVILVIVATVAIWLLGYIGAPDILTKVVIAIAVLIALIMLLELFGLYTFPWHDRGTVIVH